METPISPTVPCHDPRQVVSERGRLFAALDGWTGLLQGVATTVAFYLPWRLTGGTRPWLPVTSGTLITLLLLALRLHKGHGIRVIVLGAVGAGVAMLVSVMTGEARNYFLPGLILQGLYVLVLPASIFLGKPAALVVADAILRGDSPAGLTSAARTRAYQRITLFWWVYFTVQFGVKGYFYLRNQPDQLALSKLLLDAFSLACLAQTWRILGRATPVEPAP